MEVTLEENGTTARTLKITVPQERYAEKLDARLRHLARTVRMKGFRPGHVPIQVVRQRHLQEAHESVASKLIGTSLEEALIEKQLSPVVAPKVHIDSLGEDMPFCYHAEFDVFPVLTEEQVKGLTLMDWQVEIEASDVEAAVDHLRERMTEWKEVERPIAFGDKVKLRWEQTQGDAEVPPEISDTTREVELDVKPNTALDKLWDDLLGMRIGDEKLLQTSSADAGRPQLEQAVSSRIQVTKICEPHKPMPDNPEFLKNFGCENIDELSAVVRRHLGHQRDEILRSRHRAQIINGLLTLESGKMEIPPTLPPWCLKVRMQEAGLEKLPEDNHPLYAAAQSDASQITTYQALRTLAGLEPTDEDRDKVEEAFIAQHRNAAEAIERIRKDTETRDYLGREAMWEALIRWVFQRAQAQTHTLSMKQLQTADLESPQEETQ